MAAKSPTGSGLRRAALATLAAAALVSGAAADPAGALAAPRQVAAAVTAADLPTGELDDISAVSPTNAWAVGSTDPNGSPSGGNDLIVHFDGSGWKQVPSPVTTSSALAGVKARAANDVWAVGQVAAGQFSTRTLVLHFNGTSWTRIPSPSPGSTASLAAVTATSATNAWAVGVYQSGFRRLLLLEHWNGHTWRRVVAPRVPKDFVDAQLLGVTALSARNVWAVGTMTTCGCGPGAGVILHFNGRRWRRLPASGRIQTLSGVSASSARRVWAVGVSGDGDAPTRAEIVRFNGAHWRRVGAPSPGFVHKHFDGLSGVAARSAHDVWAVGGTGSSTSQPLIERWNGRHWKLVRGAPIGNGLQAVAVTSAANAWAVGVHRVANQPDRAVVEHWDGHVWQDQPIA